MLFALQNPVAENKLNGVTVSFTTGPNVVSYDYTVSCYAPVDDISTTDCGAVGAADLEPISSVTGTLPRGSAEVNVEMGLYLNAVADCLVTVSGGPLDKVTKCQYAPASGPPAAPLTAFVTSERTNSILSCAIDGTSVSGCPVMDATGDPFNSPEGIAISGSIAYMVNNNGNSVTACTIEDGTSLTGCVQTGSEFDRPSNIAISGSMAYVVNLCGDSPVTACTIAGTSLTDCAVMDVTGDGLGYAYGIAVSGSVAYVTNYSGNSVTACTISGTSLTGCSATGAEFDSPAAIAISGSTAYVTSYYGSSVTACTIAGTSLTDCAVMDVTGDGLGYAYGIAVSGSVAYVTNYSGNSVTACTISGTSLTDCVSTTALPGPYGIALY